MAQLIHTLSVVMPYYNNAHTLLACITSFIEQEGACAHEIIIVDDGLQSTAQKLVASQAWPLPVRVLRTVRKGQSAATNAGIKAATSEVVLLTCADIIATPRLLSEHLDVHAQHPDVGVFGHIEYAPWLPVTPIMAYLAQPKVQFDFASITNPHDAPGRMLYAPNVSVRRQWLLRAGLFDEALTYGYQDCDLGLKLSALGLRFVYRKQALVWHDHPNSVRGFVSRQYRINTLWPIMAKRYPALANVPELSAHLDHYVPMLPLLGHLRDVAEKANARGFDGSADARRLFALFGTLGSIAMMGGIVADLPALGEVLDLEGRPWARALNASPNTLEEAWA